MSEELDRLPIIAPYRESRARLKRLPAWVSALLGAGSVLPLIVWFPAFAPISLAWILFLVGIWLSRRDVNSTSRHGFQNREPNPWQCQVTIFNGDRSFELGVGDIQFRTGMLIWTSKDMEFRLSRQDVEVFVPTSTLGDFMVRYMVEDREMEIRFAPNPSLSPGEQVFGDFFRIWDTGPTAYEDSVFPPIAPPIAGLNRILERRTYGIWVTGFSLGLAIACLSSLISLALGHVTGDVFLILETGGFALFGLFIGRSIWYNADDLVRTWAKETYFASTLLDRPVPPPKRRSISDWSGHRL